MNEVLVHKLHKLRRHSHKCGCDGAACEACASEGCTSIAGCTVGCTGCEAGEASGFGGIAGSLALQYADMQCRMHSYAVDVYEVQEFLCLAQLSSRCSVQFLHLKLRYLFPLSKVHQTCLRLCSPLCLGHERSEIAGTIWTSSTFHAEATILSDIHVSPHYSIIQAVALPCL